MSTNFNNWFRFDLRKSTAFDNYEDVLQRVNDKIGKNIERDLNTQADPGLNRAPGAAVKVKTEGNRFVITSDNASEILGATSKMAQHDKSEGVDAVSVESLFEASTGVPEIRSRSDGRSDLVFRRIELENIFREQSEKASVESMKNTVTNTVRNRLGDAFEEALKEVEDENPTT